MLNTLSAAADDGWTKTIHGIEMKFDRVVENHKLIHLVQFNWQMTSLRHNRLNFGFLRNLAIKVTESLETFFTLKTTDK